MDEFCGCPFRPRRNNQFSDSPISLRCQFNNFTLWGDKARRKCHFQILSEQLLFYTVITTRFGSYSKRYNPHFVLAHCPNFSGLKHGCKSYTARLPSPIIQPAGLTDPFIGLSLTQNTIQGIDGFVQAHAFLKCKDDSCVVWVTISQNNKITYVVCKNGATLGVAPSNCPSSLASSGIHSVGVRVTS